MSAKSQRTDSAGTSTLRRPANADAAGQQPPQPERACCCSARPTMIAMIPSGEGRPAPMDLWLCGHHYRKSQKALKAAGAMVAAAAGAIDR
jgi:hypothetical protein